MQVQPYLFFEGRCEEALEFYRRALGAEITMLMRFKDAPEKPPAAAPGTENKVMHASFRVGDASELSVFQRPPVDASHTLAHFEVTDIEAVVRDLEAKGVEFLDYDEGPLQTTGHIAQVGPAGQQ